MKDKVILVTGVGTGIGKAIAKRFVDLGAFVVITGRRESILSEATDTLGAHASYIVGDVSEFGVPKNIIKEIFEQYPVAQLHMGSASRRPVPTPGRTNNSPGIRAA